MHPESQKPARRLSISQILALLGVGPLLGSAFGAMTNLINGALSPEFFADVMNYRGDIWRLSIRYGITQGALFGVLYGALFACLILAVSHCRCQWLTAMRYAVLTVLFGILLWCLGGLLAVGYVWIAGKDAGRMFGHYLLPAGDRLRYAWVSGSIFAVENGGFIAVMLSIVVYSVRRGPPLVERSKSESVTLAQQ